jgi:DNA replication protein DnaC
MGYEKHIYERAEAELSLRRLKAESEQQRHIHEIEEKFPEIIEINRKLAETSIELSKLIISKEKNFNESFNKIMESNLQGQELIKNILREGNYPGDYLEAKYSCPICYDKGYTSAGIRCQCFNELLNKFSAEELNKNANLPLCDFKHFSLSYYKGKTDKGIDCYKKMSEIFDFCKLYANTFNKNSESLFFLGKTGVGKTHLSLSIAKAVAEKGFNVAYGSIMNYLRNIEKEHFGRTANVNTDTLQVLINADLLVLDDLGSEFQTSFYESAVYNLLNSRLNMGLPTIISSNLTTDELQKRYNDRIISRIFGLYNIILCVGEDIRQIKRLKGE